MSIETHVMIDRWKRNEQNEKVIHESSGRPILQFVSIQRRDNNEWAIPGVRMNRWCGGWMQYIVNIFDDDDVCATLEVNRDPDNGHKYFELNSSGSLGTF